MATLCMQKGYEEISAEEVVELAGVSAEEFETLFGGDLEKCMLASVNAITTEVMKAISATYSADRSEWDSYLRGMKALLELMTEKPSLAYMGYIASRQLGPPRVTEAYRATTEVVSAMLERLWDYSSLEVSPAPAARAVLGAAEAVVRREIVAGRIDSLPHLLPDFTYGAMVPFVGQEDALKLSRQARELLAGTRWEE